MGKYLINLKQWAINSLLLLVAFIVSLPRRTIAAIYGTPQWCRDRWHGFRAGCKAAKAFLGNVWFLSKPYFTSEEKWVAWALLGSVVAMNLFLVWMSVMFNFWNKAFYNALQTLDYQAFWDLLVRYRPVAHGGIFGIMPGFCELAAVYILVAIYTTYITQWLQIRWRRWLTTKFINNWMSDRAYYYLGMSSLQSHTPDNPDQRIAEDVRDFVNSTLSLSVDFMTNAVTFFSFLGILWSMSGAITLWGHTIPGYMVWAALVYAVIGTGITSWIGRPLSKLRFRQQAVEGDFRYALVRLRENAEGVALYAGEADEKGNLVSRFYAVVNNWWLLMKLNKKLNALTSGYKQIAVVFPFFVAAPRYFGKMLELGDLMQISDAFGNVQGSLSWFVNVYGDLATWQAVVARLATFQEALDKVKSEEGTGIKVNETARAEIHANGLTIELGNGTKLLEDATLNLQPGTSVVVTGPSGCGKSTLFRAIRGIWRYGEGSIERPSNCLFLPQRPYTPLGSLRRAVSFPLTADHYSNDKVVAALTEAGLSHLVKELDNDDDWSRRLSGGEQQRLALARALLFKPRWLFLDEATASLDPEAESYLYQTIKRLLPETTIVSIAHRPSVVALHDKHLAFDKPSREKPGKLIEVPKAA